MAERHELNDAALESVSGGFLSVDHLNQEVYCSTTGEYYTITGKKESHDLADWIAAGRSGSSLAKAVLDANQLSEMEQNGWLVKK